MINDTLEFDVVLPPMPKRNERKGYLGAVILAAQSDYVVSSGTQNREAVWKVIQFMTLSRVPGGLGQGRRRIFRVSRVQHVGSVSASHDSEDREDGFDGKPGDRRVLHPSEALKIWQYYAPEGPNNYDILQGIWIGPLGWDALADLDRRYNGAMDKAMEEARKHGINVSRADFVFPDWDPAENYPPPQKK